MADEGFKRKLIAILSADVVGYSRLMRDDEEATVRNIAAHRVLISDIVQQHHGRIVDSPGDNILAEFVSVVDAVNGAIKIQEEIKKGNTDTPEKRRMEFRIGINLGDVIEEEERIYGDGVNIAARVEGLAAAGGVSISGTVYEHIKDKLSLGYHYLGDQDVKNISEPVRVYRLLTDSADAGKMIGEEKLKPRKPRVLSLGAFVLIILAVGLFVIWNNYFRVEIELASVDKMTYPLPDKPSIAVLPFDNMSGDPEQEYFSDGLTDELIGDLAKISGILVISRNSTFTYKGKPTKVHEIVKDLNVQYVLEGSVQRSGNQVRVRAQLIDGKTDHHIWSESYDGVMDNIFDLQDKITGEIVRALKIEFDVGVISSSKKKETKDVMAYEHFLKGWHHYLLTTKNDFIKAIDIYQKALEIDPEYSRAYAALALVYWAGSDYGSSGQLLFSTSGPLAGVDKNRTLAVKYLNLAMKHPNSIALALSSRILLYKRRYNEAIAEADKAVSQDPTSVTARFALARALIMSGRSTEALSQIEEILWLDPINPARAYIEFGLAYYNLGDLDTAYEYIEKAKIHNPMIGCDIRAIVYADKGLKDDASMAVSECQPPLWDDIRWRMQHYPFKDNKIAQNFAHGLYSAGVPGEASGYYKIYDENKLGESEIKNLLINKKIQVFVDNSTWSLEFADNNVCIYTGLQPIEKGRYWFEKDSLWLDMPQLFWGEKCQANVYKNPDGTWEVGNLYFFVSSFGIFSFSHEEE